MNFARTLKHPSYPFWAGVLCPPVTALLVLVVVTISRFRVAVGLPEATGYFGDLDFIEVWSFVGSLPIFTLGIHALLIALFSKSVKRRYLAILLCGLTVVVTAIYLISAGTDVLCLTFKRCSFQ